jgi:hypothetical protein
MRPYLLDDATIRRLDEIYDDLNFRRLQFPLYRRNSLRGVELGLQQQSKSGLDILDLFGREALSLEAERVRPVSSRAAFTDRL